MCTLSQLTFCPTSFSPLPPLTQNPFPHYRFPSTLPFPTLPSLYPWNQARWLWDSAVGCRRSPTARCAMVHFRPNWMRLLHEDQHSYVPVSRQFCRQTPDTYWQIQRPVPHIAYVYTCSWVDVIVGCLLVTSSLLCIHLISQVLWSLLIPAIWLCHHPLCGVVSAPFQILLVGMCRLCGSWPVAGHNYRKVSGKDPICADLHDMGPDLSETVNLELPDTTLFVTVFIQISKPIFRLYSNKSKICGPVFRPYRNL